MEAAIEAPGLSFRKNCTIVLQVGHGFARAMTKMKLPTAATTATMLHPASFDSVRHNAVTEGACVFVDGHWVTGLQNRPTEAGTVQNAPRTYSCLLFAQLLSEFHVELLLKLIHAVALAPRSQWRQALLGYLSICLSIYLSIYLSMHLSIYLSIHLSIYLSIVPSFYRSFDLSNLIQSNVSISTVSIFLIHLAHCIGCSEDFSRLKQACCVPNVPVC